MTTGAGMTGTGGTGPSGDGTGTGWGLREGGDWARAIRRASVAEAQAAPPPVLGDGWDQNPIVLEGYGALRRFGADLDRGQAAILISQWAHRIELSEREYRAVLRRFPVPGDVPPNSWLFMLDAEPDAQQ